MLSPVPALARQPAGRLTWRELRDLVQPQVPLLSAPRPGLRGLCGVCHGPAAAGSARCFQCDLHSQCAPGSLADTVVPVAFAIKGGPHARSLWQYKSGQSRAARRAAGGAASPAAEVGLNLACGVASGPAAAVAARQLLALLLVFLHDHGRCVWRAAGSTGGPTHLAVVPTARGRPGPHPLRALISPYVTAPWAELSVLPGGHPVRELDPDRFAAAPLPGARVLLVDDTWTTGATAQSAAMALRRAGASSVAIVVLGRHDRDGGPLARPFRPQLCPVHPGDIGIPATPSILASGEPPDHKVA